MTDDVPSGMMTYTQYCRMVSDGHLMCPYCGHRKFRDTCMVKNDGKERDHQYRCAGCGLLVSLTVVNDNGDSRPIQPLCDVDFMQSLAETINMGYSKDLTVGDV